MEKGTDPTSHEAKLVLAEEIEVHAGFQALHGKEVIAAGREMSTGLGIFTIRYREDVLSQTWEIKDWLDRIWDIRGEPREINRREGLELMAERRL